MRGEVILIADDESSMVELLEYNLRNEGYEVLTAANGRQALDTVEREKVSLLILDIMMPEVDGFEVCRQLRKTSNVPVIMLTAKSSETNKIVGLELGADDYVTKPFSVSELMARVKAVLRRSAAEKKDGSVADADIITRGSMVIDAKRREVLIGGEAIELTMKEFELLRLLAASPGVVFSRERILDEVWGGDTYIVDRAIDVHVRHLRQKIEKQGGAPGCISTVRGVGYRFEEKAE